MTPDKGRQYQKGEHHIIQNSLDQQWCGQQTYCEGIEDKGSGWRRERKGRWGGKAKSDKSPGLNNDSPSCPKATHRPSINPEP